MDRVSVTGMWFWGLVIDVDLECLRDTGISGVLDIR
jgi:hypothetical protein